ncbi:RagB/SusD family nutrient uptake outer membrane protein [Fulvivirgaceae bacterium PWU4]|uniref:RagB/SusD family nutrient uptake outer membrane protein n=1 Tax=Chryseosolibacter histidini TaxID=2782349 RepID=A0AAP2DN92_9BACT|nr:RagB/SusD family nutrient uptake outer membrane protein [Chryseosolibacter histidini]MBT1699416.1 RagB/SusD family nutrient uptake outer membrane protein [Chryseosolibacter histidini]
MKRTRIYGMLIALTLVAFNFTGCDDLLEEDPKALEQDFLENLNPGLLEQTIIGVYEPMTRSRGRLWESTVGLGFELMAEYADGGGSQVSWSNYANLLSTTNTSMNQPWITLYEAIGRANVLIDALDKDQNLSATLKDAAYGEARFVRALCYYFAVRTFGKVPLRLTPITDTENTSIPLTEIPDVYAQIVADLSFAEGVLPNTVPSSMAGRATKGAAKVALADVYLTMAGAPLNGGTTYYQQARDKAKEVMDAKATYGYDLITSLETLYSPVLPTNAEDVFSLKFSQAIDQGAFLASYYADSRAKAAGFSVSGNKFGGAISKAPLISGWDANDLRKRFNLYDSYVINGQVVKAEIETDIYDLRFGKYKDPQAPIDTGNGNDFYFYRYADVLLIFAEADNKLNGIPTAAAYDAINKVRRRGYGVDINTPSVTADLAAGLSMQQFDDLVFRERGYEFMGEAKRWFDMVRTNRAVQLISEVRAQIKNKNRKPDPTRLYFLIPDVEIQSNPLAGQ